jgi:L-ribulose-5-phosphate 3-epimerase
VKIGCLDSVLKLPWDELFAGAAEIGFPGVELGVGGDYQGTALWSADGRATLREQAAEAGVAVASVCVHTFWQVSPASPDEEVRRQSVTLLAEACENARDVGAGVILVPVTPGGEEDPDVLLARWREAVQESAWAAEEQKVFVSLENVGSPGAAMGEQVATLAESVGSEYVGVYYDPGNALRSDADPAAEIAAMGAWIRQVHIKDPGGELLGQGDLDIPAVIEALQDAGYDGWLILETPSTDNPPAAAAANMEYLEGLL